MNVIGRMLLWCVCLVASAGLDVLSAADAAPDEASIQQSFRQMDRDQSGGVSVEEFLANIPENVRKSAQHDFHLADFDRNGNLAIAEYRALRGLQLPDPWAELSAAALETWQKILKDADQNQDGELSSAEWPEQLLLKELPPLGQIRFDRWDDDQNAEVTLAEARRLIEAAYGIRHLDGAQFRHVNGDVVFGSYFRDLDRDRNGEVSEAEFIAGHWMGEARNKTFFGEIDRDQNGQLTATEFAVAERLWTHSFDAFRQLDANFDGLVSEEELGRQSPPVQNQRRRLKLGCPPFDDDHDGKFSYREYRLAPVGELYVIVDLLQRVDENHDGGITWDEFHADGDPWLSGIAWEVFRRYDRNADGHLSVDEYEFPIDGSPQGIADLFRVLDEDGSGGLTVAEFLTLTPTDQRKAGERNFRVMDFDRNETLSPEEFAAIKGGTVPDPWRKLAEETQDRLWKRLLAADTDGNQEISRAEWPAKELHASDRPFGEIEFAEWDADQNGQVTEGEVRQLVDQAYGLMTSNGTAARWPDGSVLYVQHLLHLDRDEDGSVSETEFVERHWLETERNQSLFEQLDREANKSLNMREITAKDSPLRVNLVDRFLEFDRNLDGRLNQAEILQQCPPVQGNIRAVKLGLAAFDRDDDGLDLHEFRMSPIGFLYVTVQLLNKKDTNQDGVISWTEFHPVPNPQFVGIAWEVFRRYDRDLDGELSTDEYDFPEDPQIQEYVQQVMPEVRETLKSELRFFLSICQLGAEQKQTLKLALGPMLGHVVRRAATAMKPRNVQGNLVAATHMVDSQRLFSARLAQFAEQTLSADVAALYRQEVSGRIEQQQQATILVLVSRLDQTLLLSEEQRRKISSSLREQWQPIWASQIDLLLQNDHLVLHLPDDCLVPHLSATQQEVWQKLANKTAPGPGNRVRFFGNFGENAAQDEIDELLPPQQEANQLPARVRAVRVRALEERKAKKLTE